MKKKLKRSSKIALIALVLATLVAGVVFNLTSPDSWKQFQSKQIPLNSFGMSPNAEFSDFNVSLGMISETPGAKAAYRHHCSGTIVDVSKGDVGFKVVSVMTSIFCMENRDLDKTRMRFSSNAVKNYKVTALEEFDFRGRKNLADLKLYDVVIVKVQVEEELKVSPAAVLADISKLYSKNLPVFNYRRSYESDSGDTDRKNYKFIGYHDKSLLPSVITLKSKDVDAVGNSSDPCFGDLGAGVFADYVDAQGQSRTYLLGITQKPHGHQDDEFTLDSKARPCFQKQSNFSFAGNYLKWMESLGLSPDVSGTQVDWPSVTFKEPTNLAEWCSSNQLDSSYIKAAAGIFSQLEGYDFGEFSCAEFGARLSGFTEAECSSEFDSKTFGKFIEMLPRVNTVYASGCNLESAPWLAKSGIEFAYLSNNFISRIPKLAESLVLVDLSSNLLEKLPQGLNAKSGLEGLLVGDNFINPDSKGCSVCTFEDLNKLDEQCGLDKLSDSCLIKTSVLAKRFGYDRFYPQLEEYISTHEIICRKNQGTFSQCWSLEFAENIKKRLDFAKRRGLRAF